MKKVFINITVVSVALYFLFILAFLMCNAYKKFTSSDDITIGSTIFERVSRGLVCDEEEKCIEAYIAIDAVDIDLLQAFEEKLPEIKSDNLPICFTSPGGEADIALSISNIIRSSRLSTCVGSRYVINGENINYFYTDPETKVKYNNVCLSACGFLLMSGTERIKVGNDFSIGLHEPTTVLDFCFCRLKLPFIDASDNSDIAMIISNTANIDDKVAFSNYYAFSLNTDKDDMYILSNIEQDNFNLFNAFPVFIDPA